MMCLSVDLFAFILFEFVELLEVEIHVSIIKFGNLLAIFSLKYTLCPFLSFLFSRNSYAYVGIGDGVPQVS